MAPKNIYLPVRCYCFFLKNHGTHDGPFFDPKMFYDFNSFTRPCVDPMEMVCRDKPKFRFGMYLYQRGFALAKSVESIKLKMPSRHLQKLAPMQFTNNNLDPSI